MSFDGLLGVNEKWKNEMEEEGPNLFKVKREQTKENINKVRDGREGDKKKRGSLF